MIALADLQWPVSYRFVTHDGDDFATQEITVDAWKLAGHLPETAAAGPLIWKESIATAMSSSVTLLFCEVMAWRGMAAPGIVAGGFARGHQFTAPAPRERSLVMGFHTGHGDRWGTRRHYLRGIPRGWSTDGLLNSAGWDGCMAYGHILCMGLQHDFISGGFQHLLHWTRVVPFAEENIWGVAFRRVTSYSVCEHVDKAPEYQLGVWPENPL